MTTPFVPQASVELNRIYDEIHFHYYKIDWDHQSVFGRNPPKHLTKMYVKMIKHFLVYLKNLNTEARLYWQRVLAAMARDAGDSWEYNYKTSIYEINSHLNDKIRGRIRRRSQTKPSLNKEITRVADFVHFITVFGLKNPGFDVGLGQIKRFIIGFTKHSMGSCPHFTTNAEIIKREKHFHASKTYVGTMLYRYYHKLITDRYYDSCRKDLAFVPRPGCGKRQSTLGTEVMKFMLLHKNKLVMDIFLCGLTAQKRSTYTSIGRESSVASPITGNVSESLRRSHVHWCILGFL